MDGKKNRIVLGESGGAEGVGQGCGWVCCL